jgi:hypothetical protein
MAYEVKGTEDGKLIMVDLLTKYGQPKVGRWSVGLRGGIPDRCAHCPLADIRPAIGYTTYLTRWGGRGVLVKEGYCSQHQPTLQRKRGKR